MVYMFIFIIVVKCTKQTCKLDIPLAYPSMHLSLYSNKGNFLKNAPILFT